MCVVLFNSAQIDAAVSPWGVILGQQDDGAWLTAELLQAILGSARAAGPHLMISRGDCPRTLDALTRQGWVLEKRGHIVLTAKARAQLRSGGDLRSAA